MSTTHVIGGGIAGLAAATRVAARGARVALYEATEALGGRCRSLRDPRLGRDLDHGLHLVFNGHRHVAAYVDEIGARGNFALEDWAGVRFFDAARGRAWTLRLNRGRIPWWIFAPGRNAPGSTWADYRAVARLALARRDRPLGELLGARANRRLIWDPWCEAAIRVPPDQASVRLFKQALRNSFWRGGAACRLVMPTTPISAAYVDPAAALLRARGAAIHARAAVNAIDFADGRAVALGVAGARVDLGANDKVILAVTPRAATALVPGLRAPLESCAAVTAHFVLDPPCDQVRHLVCVLDDVPSWLMLDRDRASVTIASTRAPIDVAEQELLARLWRAVALVLKRDGAIVPPGRVLRARHGSFAHTPAQAALRPGPRTAYRNLFLAGDWIDHGHSASLDAAALSGHAAAALAA